MKYLRPTAGGWCLGVASQDGQIAERPLDASLPGLGVGMCVLPVEALTVCPLWLRAVDDSFLESAIRLQLEKRNLLPETSEGKLLAYRVASRQESRILVVVMVLSAEKITQLGIEGVNAEAFSASPLAYNLAPDAMVVWKELGKDVVAFTREGEVVHFQALASAGVQSHALELSCLAMQLESEGVLHATPDVVLVSPEVGTRARLAELLDKRMGVRAGIVPALSPVSAAPPVDLLPPAEQGRRQLVSRQRRHRKITAALAAAYLLLLLSLGGRLVWLQRDVASGRERQRFLAEEVAEVRKTKELWQQVRSAVDPNEYPLEILSLCVEAIPPNGVRLTEFGVNGVGKIVLAGEADSIPMALAFKSTLTSQENLSRYDWSFPQPRNQKKGPGAVFKATGTRNDYATP